MKKSYIAGIIIAIIIIGGIGAYGYSKDTKTTNNKAVTKTTTQDAQSSNVKKETPVFKDVKEKTTSNKSNFNLNSILGYWAQNQNSSNPTYYHFFKTENGEYAYKQIALNPTNIELQELNQVGKLSDTTMSLNFTKMSKVVPMNLKRVNDNEFIWTNNKSTFNRIPEYEYLLALKQGMSSTNGNIAESGGVKYFADLYFGGFEKASNYTITDINVSNGGPYKYMVYTSKKLNKSVIINSLGQTYDYNSYKENGKLVPSYGQTLNVIDTAKA